MKKLLTLAIALILFTACSSDDSPAPTKETAVRLKKIISTNEDGEIITSNYNYTNTKLTSVISTDGSSSIYTYTGDLNTGMEDYVNYTLRYSYAYEYTDSNKIATKTMLVHNVYPKFAQKDVYTYNENGTITIRSYTGDFESQTQLSQTTIVSYPDATTIQYQSNGGTKVIYTYDGKNHPLKNVLETDMYAQNLLTVTDVTFKEPVTYVNNTYIYNSKDFPINSTEKVYQAGIYKTIKRQFFYE